MAIRFIQYIDVLSDSGTLTKQGLKAGIVKYPDLFETDKSIGYFLASLKSKTSEKELENLLKSVIYYSPKDTGNLYEFAGKRVPINKFLYLLGFSFIKENNLSSDVLDYLYNITIKKGFPTYKLLKDMSESEFTSIFGTSQDEIWYFLNSNPGAFWLNTAPEDLNETLKSQLSYEFLFHQVYNSFVEENDLPLSGENFKSIYQNLIDNKRSPFSFVQGILVGQQEEFFIHPDSFTIVNNASIGSGYFSNNTISHEVTKSPMVTLNTNTKFISNINKTLFMNKGQLQVSLLGQEISNDKKSHTINNEDIKEIAKFAKEEEKFNIFVKDFVKDNKGTKTHRYLNTLLAGGFLPAAATIPTIKKNEASPLGQVSVSLEEIGEMLNEKSQDFSDKLSQCILLTSLKDIARYSVDLRTGYRNVVKEANPKGTTFPYGGRVYPVDTVNPNTLINTLSTPRGINRFVTGVKSTDFGVNRTIQYNMSLFRVEEISGSTREYPYLFEDEKDAVQQAPIFLDLMLESYQNSPTGSAGDSIKDDYFYKTFRELLPPNKQGINNLIKVDDLSISIAGETVATVKSNIDVSITFTLPSIEAILGVFQATSKYHKNDDPKQPKELYKYSFSELLSHNIGKKFDGTNASRVLNTSYLPNKNRLVMKISPQIKKLNQLLGKEIEILGEDGKIKATKTVEGTEKYTDDELINYFQNSGMILDLLLVDYTITRNPYDKPDQITINYKGFMKSFLNEPFCDIIASTEARNQLLEKERKVISDLESDKIYCDIQKVREKIQKHYKDMRETRDGFLNSSLGRTSILEKLISRNRMFELSIKGDIATTLLDNIDKNTRKITKPGKLAELLRDRGDIKNNIKPSTDVNYDGTENITNATNIDFFYFGDLIDVLMDVIYGDPEWSYNETKDEMRVTRKLDSLRKDTGKPLPDNSDNTASEIRKKFANFPLKVILPVIYPVILEDNIFKLSKNKEDKISLADIPISVSYFQNWYEEEVSRRKTKIYPLGSMINKLLNLVNNILSDNCYTIGTLNKKYFSISTDFGVLMKKTDDGKVIFDEEGYNKNITIFDLLWNKQSLDKGGNFVGSGSAPDFITVSTLNAPLLKKRLDIERNKHVNFLCVYEQFNSFPDGNYPNPHKKNVVLTNGVNTIERDTLNKLDIPQFKMYFDDTGRSNKTIDFVTKQEFTKTDLPKAEEIRFFNDGLNELSTISAVHDCTIQCQPLLQIYPGMLCWIDSQFVDGTEVYGSIPWTMGLGGYHVVYDVQHKGNMVNGMIDQFKTTFKSKFVHSGAESDLSTYKTKCEDRVLTMPAPKNKGATEKK